MPELPEVETVVNGLRQFIVGLLITDVDIIFSKHLNKNKISKIVNHTIIDVNRRAKYIIITLDNNMYLLAHLKMTGQFIFKSDLYHFGAGHPSDSLINALPDKHTRIIFELLSKDGQKANLFFNDQRKFGYVDLLNKYELDKVLAKLGPEPLSSDFNSKIFEKILEKYSNKNIKSLLLDQSIIAGIGNIYADESLHKAKISPQILANGLSKKKKDLLYSAIVNTLENSISAGGSSSRNYVDAQGIRGRYLDNFGLVYGRANKICLTCGKYMIVKIKHAGRGTHYCPHCQGQK